MLFSNTGQVALPASIQSIREHSAAACRNSLQHLLFMTRLNKLFGLAAPEDLAMKDVG